MKVFLDTNILLDVLTHRKPFYEAAAQIWSFAERGEVEGHISAISFNNIYYIVRKLEGRGKAEKALRLLRDIFQSVAPDTQILNQSIDSGLDDFEDAIQFFSAVHATAEYILTRNPNHFPKSGPPVLTPKEFLAIWSVRKAHEKSPKKE